MSYLKSCKVCGEKYTPTGRNQKYCSKACYNKVFNSRYKRDRVYEHAVRVGKIQSPGVGSGHGSGKGCHHHNYKSGIGIYQRHQKDACEKCGSTKFLLVHHIDENRYNNTAENLETLCKSCHQKHHETRDELGRYTNG